MAAEGNVEELVGFFKSLADLSRLRIVGLLAERPRSVEELAGALGLTPGTVSHHLSRLAKAGLVSAAAKGYYSIYSLQADRLHEMAKRMLKTEQEPLVAVEAAEDDYDKKVLGAFTDARGRFTAFPKQQKKFLVLVRHALREFEEGKRYPEKEVNRILKRFTDDTAAIRRAFVDHGMMRREGGGGSYWRT
jgi:biotin operon repressor